MSNYRNSRKQKFIKGLLELPSIEDPKNDLVVRMKFNFSYFDSTQEYSQDFKEWEHEQLFKLFEKIKEYSKQPLEYWRQQRAGRGGLKVFSTYKKFPTKSKFFHPAHVPHQAEWGRFHIEKKPRLIGFTIPGNFHNRKHCRENEMFDKNTFYVVFLDAHHKFYL
jgi:hypothetical protein